MTKLIDGPGCFTAVAERSGDWWAITVQGQRGVHSQAKRLDQVKVAAAEALSMALDRDVSPDHVRLHVVEPEAAGVARAKAAAARAAADEASTATRDAVRELLAMGLTVRDIGTVMLMSHQRAAVLAREVGHPSAAPAVARPRRRADGRPSVAVG